MQWKRENFYLYGLVEPLTGEYFIWEFSHLNAACFNIFLEKFSASYAQDLHIPLFCHSPKTFAISEF